MAISRTGTVAIYYEDTGQGPPVILIHGHGVDSRLWDPQVPALLQAGFRVVRYDCRGHGRTEKPLTGFTYLHHADDLRALIANLGVGQAHLVGLSMGAGIALVYAQQRPERVASLTLISPALPGFTYSSEFTQEIERLRDAIRREGPWRPLEQLWLNSRMFATLRRYPEQFERVRFMMRSYSALDYLLDEDQPDLQVIERLGEVLVPTLVIAGEEDLPDFREIAEILAANIPGAQGMTIEGAGHVLNLEKPDAVNRALVDFLRSITPTRARA